MSTGLKVVLWVVGGIAVLLTAIIAAGAWLTRSMVGTIEDAIYRTLRTIGAEAEA